MPAHESSGPTSYPHQGLTEVRAFLDRLGHADAAHLERAIAAWHDIMRSPGADHWFRAEASLAAAINDLGLRKTQLPILADIADLFRRAPWFRTYGGQRVDHFTDASGQYVVTIAALSLLARAGITEAHFETLYGPAALLVAAASLVPMVTDKSKRQAADG
jgi:hypothetical protein